MPIPPAYPDWDTNATDTMAITSGHATDGYVASEVPDHKEFNQILMLLGLWIRYLAAGGGDKTITLPAIVGDVAWAVAPTQCFFNSAGDFVGQHNDDVFVMPIVLEPGSMIKSVSVYLNDGGFTTDKTDVAFFKRQVTTGFAGDPAGTQVGATQVSAGASGVQKLTVSGLTEVVGGDGWMYWAKVNMHAGSTLKFNVMQVIVTYTPAAP